MNADRVGAKARDNASLSRCADLLVTVRTQTEHLTHNPTTLERAMQCSKREHTGTLIRKMMGQQPRINVLKSLVRHTQCAASLTDSGAIACHVKTLPGLVIGNTVLVDRLKQVLAPRPYQKRALMKHAARLPESPQGRFAPRFLGTERHDQETIRLSS